MVKPLSQKLSEMSVRAKKAEDDIAAAEKEAHDKIEARREQSRTAVKAAVTKVDQDIKSAGESAAGKWRAVQTKIASDLDALKANMAERHHERDVKRAGHRADYLEWEASIAVDYALASIEQAKLAVYDAIIGRVDAEKAKTS